MRLFLMVVSVITWLSLFVAGCSPARYVPSLIHPYKPGKSFQECSVDLSFYKPVQERPGQDPNIAFAVAASGGGYRAANFATGALLGLEELKDSNSPSHNALSEVDYFSSVSGGGFAVSAYLATLSDYRRFTGSTTGYLFANAIAPTDEKCPCDGKPAAQQNTDPCTRKHLLGLYKDFIGDFLRTLLPWNHLGFDARSQRFEQAIDDDALGYRWRRAKLRSMRDPNAAENATLTLAEIFVRACEPNRQVILPYWFTNATVYNNSVIFPFSPDNLRSYDLTAYYHRCSEKKIVNTRKSQQDPNDFILNIPLSTGVTSSANFPLAMPPLRFTSKMDPNNPYFYLLDGGVADNLGIITAARILTDPVNQNIPRKCLVVIDSYQGEISPFEKAKKPPNEADTAMHLMGMGLDSWRARYREVAERLSGQSNIKMVCLSFDDLVDADFNDLHPFGLTEQDETYLCKNKPKDCPHATPFYLLRSISMTAPAFWGKHGLEYQLHNSQQNLLIAAGRYVVYQKRTEILTALAWNSSQ
jgi:hypothetical protein